MIPWQRLDCASLPPAPSAKGASPAPAELALWRRGDELSIRIGGLELMNSRQHHSEDELGRLACAHVAKSSHPRVLIGGLGMGFTLRAALDAVGPGASIEVAELLSAVVRWNREVLGELAGRPLDDPRARVFVGDVAERLGRGVRYDVIVLDVDNGPAALSAAANDRLYSRAGLATLAASLAPRGVLAVWSVTDEPSFSRRLAAAGFAYQRHHVRARPGAGATHVITLATVPVEPTRPSGPSGGGGRPGSAARHTGAPRERPQRARRGR